MYKLYHKFTNKSTVIFVKYDKDRTAFRHLLRDTEAKTEAAGSCGEKER